MSLTRRRATTEDLPAVLAFYNQLMDDLENAPYHPLWKKGEYPNEDFLRTVISRGELWLATEGSDIAGAVVVNHDANEGYLQGNWCTDAAPGEYAVVHALAVGTAFQHRGIGGLLLKDAILREKEAGAPSIRLDLINHNLPAEPFYTRLGFRKCGSVRLFYDSVGWQLFHLYEYPL